MGINKAILKRVVHFLMFLAIITIMWSCSGNEDTSSAKETDSINMENNTMSTTTANEQNMMINDSAGNTGNNNNVMDAVFIMKAAEINMEEIKLGKLAQQKGTISHVKELAKMMVTEHTEAMAGLTAMANNKMVTIPTAESDKIMDAYRTLNGKKGKDFDKAYSDMMVNGHKEAIALFEKTATATKDAEVKAMTTAMIPKLKMHLEHSEACQKECEKM